MGKLKAWLTKTPCTKKDLFAAFCATLAVIFSIVVLSQCIASIIEHNKEEQTAKDPSEGFTEKTIAPNMVFFGVENNNWRYYVDENTDVLYIVHTGDYGITPALNADGTPMTRAQLISE